MPSGNGAARSPSKAPPDVAPDLRRFESRFHSVFGRAGGPLSDAARATEVFDLLVRFGLLVHAQAESQALIARGDRSHLFTRHVLDSLNPLNLFASPPGSAIDIGAGAGFPGIPLAVVWPATRFTLLESRERKAGFLERAVRELGLRNVTVVCERLETLGSGWRVEPVEAVFVRAVGGLDHLLAGIAPAASHSGCRWIYFLGGESDAAAIRDGLGARGLGSGEVMQGLFGGRLLTGELRATE